MRQIFVILLFFCGTEALPYTDPVSILFENDFIPTKSINALGRIAQPGDFYERGRDLILPNTLFKKPFPKDKITTDDIRGNDDATQSWGMTFTEMANRMKLSMDEKLSIALGITKPIGTSSFLTTALERSPNPTGTACIFTRSVTRDLSILDRDVLQLVSLEILDKTNATDVITSVKYGLQACYNVSPESNSSSQNAGQFVNATLSGSLVKRSPDLICQPGMTNKEPLALSEEEVIRKNSKIAFKSDFGEPIVFELLPLSEVRKRLNSKKKPEIPYHEVPDNLGESLIETAEKLRKVKNNLSEFWNQTLCQPIILPVSKLSSIQPFVTFWSSNIIQGISKMADAVTAYRNGTANESTLTTAHDNFSRLLSEYESSYRLNEPKISVKPADLAEYKKLADSVTLDGVRPITNADAMNELMRSSKTFVVLKYKLDWILENPEDWEQLRSIFLGYHGMWNWFGNPDKYLLDCDLLPEHCKGVYSMRVNRYKAGQLEGIGDYLCAVSRSFMNQIRKNPYGAFQASWVIEEPFRKPYKQCRTRRVLTRYQGAFWEQDLEVII